MEMVRGWGMAEDGRSPFQVVKDEVGRVDQEVALRREKKRRMRAGEKGHGHEQERSGEPGAR